MPTSFADFFLYPFAVIKQSHEYKSFRVLLHAAAESLSLSMIIGTLDIVRCAEYHTDLQDKPPDFKENHHTFTFREHDFCINIYDNSIILQSCGHITFLSVNYTL